MSLLSLAILIALGGRSAVQPAPPEPLDPRHGEKMAAGLKLFRGEVREVLMDNCLRCHGGAKTRSDFDLSTREALLRGGKRGPAVVAGDSRASRLYELIAHSQEPHMPHGREKLAPGSIERIARWIDLGAPYDTALQGSARTGAMIVDDEDRQFRSFRPIADVTPPEVADGSSCSSTIDRFVVRRLEEAGIHQNPPASRKTLIRRVYFDLIGLPPSPEDIRAFVEDRAPDAYERLVDRLLADPRHGERWGRHWLDLARFAESHGFEHDYDRKYAYHYRDFVIEALNRDLSYDTFVHWQIAGDEVAPDEPLAMAATGFLAAGVHATQITANQVEKERYDELDDIANTLGTAMLGLSVGCARCHDHKYDPIPTQDYYRLISTFTTTVRSDHDVVLNAAEHRGQMAVFAQKHEKYTRRLEEFEAEVLPSRFADWLGGAPRASDYKWVVPEVVKAETLTDVAHLEPLADGSFLVTGTHAIKDTYTIVFKTALRGITAIRIDAMADGSLPAGGPGRQEDGNFNTKFIEMEVKPAGSDGEAQPVEFLAPEETFVDGGEPISTKLDGSRLEWVVESQHGKTHTLVARLREPLRLDGPAELTFTLGFRRENKGAMGRPRISVTTETGPVSHTWPVAPQDIKQLLADGHTLAGGAGQGTGEAIVLSDRERETLTDWYAMRDPQWRRLYSASQVHYRDRPKPLTRKMLISSEGVEAVRLHSQGADYFEDTYFLNRGDPNQKLGKASQGFLQALVRADRDGAFPDVSHWRDEPPSGWKTSYRRRALAKWLTDVDSGAGPLLARVIVNRLWQHHLGRGIVSTASDFGAQGAPPTHPELLEWLAGDLVRGGWSLKGIHRRILLSAAYRQSTAHDEARERVDPQNALWWRREPRRLEAEVIRDALLAVGGVLEPRMFGPGTLDEGHRRRSIYFFVKRSELVPMMILFDGPDALQGLAQRATTTIAPQALLLMNNPRVRTYAEGFSQRVRADAETLEGQISGVYELALGRLPTAEELGKGLGFVQRQASSYDDGESAAEARALADFCQIVMSLNEFVYVE